MSKSAYKIIEVIGSSPESWEDAARYAIEKAAQSIKNLRIAEVVEQDMKIEDGKITAYRTKMRLSFKIKD
jgi:hypothetical protein